MPLHVTPVNRNLQTRVTFMFLEFEDLFVVLGAAAVMNVVGHFVGGEIAGMPMNLVLQYGVPLFMVPDATFPGVLRELIGLDFPIIVNAQITIPDQAKVLKGYKGRLRKMQAAQKDANGGFRINVEARVFAITVRNGKLTNIREYIDTQALARASEMPASPRL